MKTTNLTWRLGKLPTPDEVRELVKDKIITQEEARAILFKESDSKEVNSEALEEEIKFLRKLVEKLSNGNYNKVTEYIYTYPKPTYGWYDPYKIWCTTGYNTSSDVSSASVNYVSNGSNTLLCSSSGTTDFSNIKTF